MSQSAQPTPPPFPPLTQRQIMNIVGVGILAALVLFGLMCLRFVGPNERAYVRGERALAYLDDSMVIKWPWESTRYIELKTYTYTSRHEARLLDGKWLEGYVDDNELGADFEVSFDYDLTGVDDTTAKWLTDRVPPNDPLNYFFQKNLPKDAQVWYTGPSPEAHLKSVAKELPVTVKNFTVKKKEKAGRTRVASLQLIGSFFADAQMPLKFSGLIRERRTFEYVARESSYRSGAFVTYIKEVFTAAMRPRTRY